MRPTEITASFEELMRQGPMTAQVYFNDCLKIVDGTFGEGYSKKNPAVLAACIQASAMDCTMGTLAQQLRRGLDRIADHLEGGSTSRIAEVLEENLPDIVRAINDIPE